MVFSYTKSMDETHKEPFFPQPWLSANLSTNDMISLSIENFQGLGV
jgi:hypothetical protein